MVGGKYLPEPYLPTSARALQALRACRITSSSSRNRMRSRNASARLFRCTFGAARGGGENGDVDATLARFKPSPGPDSCSVSPPMNRKEASRNEEGAKDDVLPNCVWYTDAMLPLCVWDTSFPD